MERPVRVWPLPPLTRDGSLVVPARVEGAARRPLTIWFQMDASYAPWLTPSAHPWVLALLMPAMRRGSRLVVHGAVSPDLIRHLDALQDIWVRWWPGRYRKVEIAPDSTWNERPRTGDVVACFSGGLDSSHSVFRHATGRMEHPGRAVTAALTVLGFDIPLSAAAPFDALLARWRPVLGAAGVEPLAIATNLRDLSQKWPHHHGIALAASMHLLSGRFAGGMLASSIGRARATLTNPHGSHLLTDHLFGSTAFPIVHDGAECDRPTKLNQLTAWPAALANLQVCWETARPAVNCGRCHKCIRTKLCFLVNGLDVPPILGTPPGPDEIRRWPLTDAWQRIEAQALVDAASRRGVDREPWCAALRDAAAGHSPGSRALRRNRARQFVRVKTPQWLQMRVSRATRRGIGLRAWEGPPADRRGPEFEPRASTPGAASPCDEGQWAQAAHLWTQMGSPLRPVDEDIRFVEEAVHEWAGRSRAPRALLLGVTPEIYRLTWPSGTDLIAVDRTPAMIHAVWPGPRSAVRCADWTSMDLPAASRDIVMCDGGWHLLAYPTEQQALVRVLARVVADHGRVILRLFVPPRERERPEDVLADLADGHIPNLNVLKLRLGMSMMASVAEGVELAAIWRRLNDAHPDLDALADRLGWSRDHARAIHAYRTSHARYHFASLADVRDMVSRDPGGFEVTAIREPSYHLGDRCLTMILTRCGR